MKTKLISGSIAEEKINWDDTQLMKGYSGLVVLTTGVHKEDEFQGIVLIENETYMVGVLSSTWIKESFSCIDGELTIKFIP